jgi:hypothetical protein
MVMNANPKRRFDFDCSDGRVSFEGWHGLNDFEKLAAKGFEEGLENNLQLNPPCLMLEPNEDSSDLTIQIWLQALGDGDNGPCWECSMKETFNGVDSDYSDEDQMEILKSLEAVTEYVRALIRAGLED